ncbi:DsbA family protein [Pseudoalteromonas sp. NBT06-2]|uniref:DsbA family protein n=1 Tax=Pseudoalteromonas sp. NBT06-2 TaxID=2025950 RepID=UPI000BA6B715|nr:DsbA family protein [Pseudoalteromonas sp. NBT06-2]PAJ73950.1 DsbA family protein [Pseudoalteromonas sp. NBT06-2]
MTKPTLYYVYDPMCSWCWGYKNVWDKLRQVLAPFINIDYMVGGLAPDSDVTMSKKMQEFLQSTWKKIETEIGTQFNHEFWNVCTPRRSTYPACRAVIIAREYQLEQQMLDAIQKAYYLNAKNPSDNAVLISLAKELGIDEREFTNKLVSKTVNNFLIDEIALIQKMPVQGFPSLILLHHGQYHQIPINYNDWTKTFGNIKSYL